MVLDYSKWDALELSDDSDIEVHPNVDKRSFIRAKQEQIHQTRDHRRHQITTLKYEQIINDGLILRINRLLTALKSHKGSSQNPDELVLQSLIESAGDPAEDQPPTPPPGVHDHVQEKPTYSKMMAALVDQVKKEVDEKHSERRYDGFISEVEGHRSKVEGLQKELLAKLAELEAEDKKHITSDDIQYGFDVSHIAKKDEIVKAGSSKNDSKTVEVLNPGALERAPLGRSISDQSSGAEADIEDAVGTTDDDSDVQASAKAKEFAKIPYGDYRADLQFITDNPEILAERETDGLLIEAFDAELESKPKYARQCVHQALLIQYCRQLGRDGVQLFFKRITTKDHQAQALFLDDVQKTYGRIHTRAAEIRAERAQNPQSSQGVEQIQLHAVDPNTTINISIPTADSEDKGEVESRKIFDSFPPGLQRALESKSLDEVNKILAKMSVEEAEEVVEKLGDGGMLSLEEGVIDATTDEGQRMVEEIERTKKMPGTVDETELSADPE